MKRIWLILLILSIATMAYAQFGGGPFGDSSTGGASSLSDLSDVTTSTATAGNLLLADGTDFEAIAMSGDVTISSAGVTMITTDAVQLNEIDLSIVPIWTGAHTFSVDVTVPEEDYGVGWNGSLEVPTKDDVFDQIQVVSGLSAASSLTDLSDVTTATVTAGYLLLADGTDWESIAMSGDVSITSAGVTLIDTTIAKEWSGLHSFTLDVLVPEENYGSGWNGSLEVPTKDDVFDQMEIVSSLSGGSALSDLSDVTTSTATAGNLLLADGVDWESISMSGDVTISSAGVTMITTDAVQLNEIDLSIVPIWTGAHTFTQAVTVTANVDTVLDTNTLVVDVSEDYVGINTLIPQNKLDIRYSTSANIMTFDSTLGTATGWILYNTEGEAAYVFPNTDQNGITVQSTRP